MMSEAQKRAKKRYQAANVKRLVVEFYPSKHDLYEAAKERAKVYGGISAYIQCLIEKDMAKERA